MRVSDYPKVIKKIKKYNDLWTMLPFRELYDFFDQNGVNVCVVPIFAQKRFLQFGAAVYWADDTMKMVYQSDNWENSVENWIEVDYTSDEQPTKHDFRAFDNREEAEKAAFFKAFEILESIQNQNDI